MTPPDKRWRYEAMVRKLMVARELAKIEREQQKEWEDHVNVLYEIPDAAAAWERFFGVGSDEGRR